MPPAEGAWFFVWLRPQWVLLAFPSDGRGETGHSDLWDRHVAPQISGHYGVDPDRVFGIDSIRSAYAGMQRGRVVHKGGRWILYHGGDTPVAWGRARKMLVARFGLAAEARKGNVAFAIDEHETMIPEDQRTLTLAIGRIPYGSQPR